MSYSDVLRDVQSRGLRLSVAGTDLRLEGPRQRIDPELVGRIKAVKTELIEHLAAGPPGFGLTLLQRGYLIGRGESVEIGNVASHIYHEIDGCWDIARLQAALRAVVARHGMLRTRFTQEGRAIEEAEVDARIGVLDLRGEPDDRQQELLAELRAERSHRLLPIDQAPLLAADVTVLRDDAMRLHVGHDGLVLDGISMFAFLRYWHHAYTRELGAAGDPADGGAAHGTHPADGGAAHGAYPADGAHPADGGDPADGGEVSFADYVAAVDAERSGPAARRARGYWLDRLADLPPHPALPLQGSPAAITVPRFVQHTVRLDQAAWTALKAAAAGAGLTPTVVLLTGYAHVLHRWGAGDRFTLASTIANRPPIHPQIAGALGNFSQTLLIELDLSQRGRSFAERAQALQAQLRTDLDHRHFSGIEVLREIARSDAAAARMPYTFNSAIGYVRPEIDGSALDLFGPEVYTSSQTPQLWLNGFAFEAHGGVIVQFDEVAGLFPAGMIADLAQGYQRLLDGLVAGWAWSAVTFDLLPARQRASRQAANDTAAEMTDCTLADLVAEQAAKTPDAPAVLWSGGSLSYGELLCRAAAAAGWLRARGTGADQLVGLIMRRGPEQITGIVAALLAGGAYLPVDAALPAERIRYMLRDGRVRCVLTNSGWRPAGDDGIEALVLDAASGPTPDTASTLALGAATGISASSAVGPPDDGDPDDLAYVLYTSGTTGEPKGVMVSHRSVANVVADCNARFGVGPGDRFIGVSAFNFDLSVYDIFGALSAGAAVVLPDADRAVDPAHWRELCERFGVTIWNSVPALAGLMAEQAEPADRRLGALRLVMMSGDRIPPALPAQLRRVKPDLELMSLGGPTETTIWNISYPIGEHDPATSIPYGKPNANNRAYVLDADGLDAPDWVTGEICAAGTGLARGYWADEDRTAQRFWLDEARGERLYRTGDLGRYLPDGTIEIAGRSDFQIKVNGYRIEAGEVETRLAAIGAVKLAVVVRQAGARGDRLVAHLVAAGDDRPADEAIRQLLREHLPDYMTPAAIYWHDNLPLTRNGKVDRGKLVAATPAVSAAGAAARPGRSGETSATERALAELWAAVLKLDPAAIAADSDFYDLGGDSLAAARILTRVRKQFGVSITLDRLHEVRTVEAMADFLTSTA